MGPDYKLPKQETSDIFWAAIAYSMMFGLTFDTVLTMLVVSVDYAMAYGDDQLNAFMNSWIELKEKDGTMENLYNYRILGQGAVEKEPRWSIIRKVFHWVE